MSTKKLLLILVVVLSLFALTGCGNDSENTDEGKNDKKNEDVKDQELNNEDKDTSEENLSDMDKNDENPEEEIKEGASVGDLAIDFDLKSFTEDKNYKLSDFRGKGPVIIKFFASWCGPCHKEMPSLNEVYQEYKDKGLTVLAVNVGNSDNETDVKKLIDDYVLEFPVLQDWEGDTAIKYLVRSIPVNVFVDKDGNITAYKTGMQTKEQYVEEVEKIIDSEM